MRDSRSLEAFAFAFEPPLDTWARWFAIVPTRSFVRIDDHGLEAVYGSWRVATTWSNVHSVERTGPYLPWKVAGPVHVSWADRGITMAATTVAGVCLRLYEPVPGLDPLGLFRHPAVTLGVDDADRFVRLVDSHRGRGSRVRHCRRTAVPRSRPTPRCSLGAAELAATERRPRRPVGRRRRFSDTGSCQRHRRSAARDRCRPRLSPHVPPGRRRRHTLG